MEKKNERNPPQPLNYIKHLVRVRILLTEKSVKYPKPLGELVDEWKTREKSWRRLKDEREKRNRR